MSEELVFCKNCKYYSSIYILGTLYEDYCVHESNIVKRPYYNGISTEYVEFPKSKNGDADCKYFEPREKNNKKWYEKLWDWF